MAVAINRVFLAVAFGVAVSVAPASHAIAAPITYTSQVTGSGFLDATEFVGANVLVTMISDTTHVTGGPDLFLSIGTATVTVSGIGSDTFSDVIQTVSNHISTDGGFGDRTTNSGILFTFDAAFSAYDLTTAFGPITGRAFFNPRATFATNAGTFELDGVSSGATFTAVTSSVPEPLTLSLVGAGVAGAMAFRRRRGDKGDGCSI